ncbi:MAG: DNA recombination protein RmuC [Pseudomonadota bacterium]
MTFPELLEQTAIWPWLGVAALLGLLIGALVAALIARSRSERQALEIARLEQQIRDDTALQREREQLMELMSTRLTGEFGQLAQKTMRANSETFLQLAEEHLGSRQKEADSALAAREQAVATLVKPISEALRDSRRQIEELEKARSQAYGGITEQLANMQATTASLQHETRNLITALRRPEVRGQWGEITLRRLVEMAGMVEHCDFVEQATVRGEDGSALRPDLIVRMPDERELVVDVKTPLDAYLSAIEATDEQERKRFLKQHARKVADRIAELSRKSYWAQFTKSPEFVILFIPGDQFLTAALNEQPTLIDDALRQNIILATPTSFVALLKAVAYGWRQLSLAENAEHIRKLAVDLHDRLAVYAEHMARVGNQLDGSVRAYNKAVGSLERNVLPGARKFTELGVQPRKQLDELSSVESSARDLQALMPGDTEADSSGDST